MESLGVMAWWRLVVDFGRYVVPFIKVGILEDIGGVFWICSIRTAWREWIPKGPCLGPICMFIPRVLINYTITVYPTEMSESLRVLGLKSYGSNMWVIYWVRKSALKVSGF
jgi:hypothetical protein